MFRWVRPPKPPDYCGTLLRGFAHCARRPEGVFKATRGVSGAPRLGHTLRRANE